MFIAILKKKFVNQNKSVPHSFAMKYIKDINCLSAINWFSYKSCIELKYCIQKLSIAIVHTKVAKIYIAYNCCQLEYCMQKLSIRIVLTKVVIWTGVAKVDHWETA